MALYELVILIGIDVIFVTVVFLVVFLGPARFRVFLTAFGFSLRSIPSFRDLTRLKLGVVFTRIALPRRFDKSGIDHLSGTGDITFIGQLPMKAGKHNIDQI